MNKFLFLLVLLSFISCKSHNNQNNNVLKPKEWRDLLMNTLPFAEGEKPYIYYKYENRELANIILNNSNLESEFPDSVLNQIRNRKNKAINASLDKMLNITFINDTSKFKKNYEIFSEPFYIRKNLVCILMINRKVKKNTKSQFLFFLKKQNNESLKVFKFYDINKKQFYKSIPLK